MKELGMKLEQIKKEIAVDSIVTFEEMEYIFEILKISELNEEEMKNTFINTIEYCDTFTTQAREDGNYELYDLYRNLSSKVTASMQHYVRNNKR